jgi:adenylate cyclase
LMDVRITPVSKAYPGVEVHANLLSGMLDSTNASTPSYKVGYELSLLLLLSLILWFVLPRVAALKGAAIALSLLGALFAFNWVAYTQASLVLPLSSGLAMVLTTYVSYLAYAFFVESKAKRQITRLFGTYVPPELVDEMARDPEQYSLAAQSKEMTVMFCDIRDFTRLSETMSPTQLSELINQVFSVVTEVVQAHRGTLDKYMGDAVMAFWGAPVDTAKHAELAVKAALAIKPAIDTLNDSNRALGLPAISLGVGVNTGTMFVGDMGSRVRRAYTVVGDAVNLASRLEGLTRLYGVDVVCGQSTWQQCRMFDWRELDTVQVKGKLVQATLYEPLPQARAEPENAFTFLHTRMLTSYQQQRWDEALQWLVQYPPERGVMKRLFVERIAQYQQTPPPSDWDGSFKLEGK